MNWQVGNYRNLPDGYGEFLSSLSQSENGFIEIKTDSQYICGRYIETNEENQEVLYVSAALGAVGATAAIIRVQLLWVTALSLVIAFVIAWFLARRFAVPVGQLSDQAIAYNGEAYFENTIFALNDGQKSLAISYAQNLSALLSDGSYQVLSDTEFSSLGVSYDGVVFTDGYTQVVYYNQMDERWKDLPYGTDDIGHYGCGPTSMAIVVSSLTDETVDPPHMAQWAYENGHWCSKSGSYHSIVTGAAQAWGLNVTASPRNNPQALVDALSSGKLVVAIMGPGHFTRHGHFIVLRGVTSGGKVLVADPASRSRSSMEWDMTIITAEASRNASGDCPFWIIGN